MKSPISLLVEALLEGAFVAGAVAHEERQAFVVERAVFFEAAALESFGAIAQPVVLGHAVDQDMLGFGFGAMLTQESAAEDAIGFGAFERKNEKNVVVAAEAVAKVIAGRGGFALFRFGACGMFRVGSVGGDLRFGRHIFRNSFVRDFRAEGVRAEG